MQLEISIFSWGSETAFGDDCYHFVLFGDEYAYLQRDLEESDGYDLGRIMNRNVM